MCLETHCDAHLCSLGTEFSSYQHDFTFSSKSVSGKCPMRLSRAIPQIVFNSLLHSTPSLSVLVVFWPYGHSASLSSAQRDSEKAGCSFGLFWGYDLDQHNNQMLEWLHIGYLFSWDLARKLIIVHRIQREENPMWLRGLPFQITPICSILGFGEPTPRVQKKVLFEKRDGIFPDPFWSLPTRVWKRNHRLRKSRSGRLWGFSVAAVPSDCSAAV
jgi:hypothetical protein